MNGPVNRQQLLVSMDKVVRCLTKPPFSSAIDEIYLLGSLISEKKTPNDVDLMIIGSFELANMSVLRSQQKIREKIVEVSNRDFPVDYSINFGENIESIQFQDGSPLEGYLLIYSRSYPINWKGWFSSGEWRQDIIDHLGIIDTHALRWEYPLLSGHLKTVSTEGMVNRLEDIRLPKEAIWTFLNKRMNVPLPENEWEMFHPKEWTGCTKCGNCCRDFASIGHRFVGEIPKIYDIIVSEFGGKLWNGLTIQDEAEWFWIVEYGLDDFQIEEVTRSNAFDKIPCPFLKTANAEGESLCLIYENRPNGCVQFPEYREDLIEYNCQNENWGGENSSQMIVLDLIR